MGVTQARNTESQERNSEAYFIDFDLFDSLMNAKGIRTATARAGKGRTSRSTYYRMIKHEVGVTLPVAMRYAKAAGTSVNKLFPPHASGNGNPTPPPPPGPSSPPPPPAPRPGGPRVG